MQCNLHLHFFKIKTIIPCSVALHILLVWFLLYISPNNEDCLSGALLIFQWVQRQPNYIVSLPFFVLCALPSIDTFHWLGTLKSTPTRTPRVFNLLLHYTSILHFFLSKPDKSQDKVTAWGGRNWVWWCFVGFQQFLRTLPSHKGENQSFSNFHFNSSQSLPSIMKFVITSNSFELLLG